MGVKRVLPYPVINRTLLLILTFVGMLFFSSGQYPPPGSDPSTPLPANAFGATPGEFSGNGSAVYNIPIDVPPGINGMQPNLSIVYNSDGGNGLLGMGFDIGGLSRITRIGASEFFDGYNRGVTYTNSDRFALDGQRLVMVGSNNDGASGEQVSPETIDPNAYGMDGITYRTSRDCWRNVISNGASGNGPATFTVLHPNGNRYEYGTDDAGVYRSDDTRYPTGTSATLNDYHQTVRIWALSKVMDLNRNTMTFSYYRHDDTGDLRIKQIDYGGNDGTGESPQRSVRFIYEKDQRADHQTIYVRGASFQISTRLSQIQTYLDDKLVKTYDLSYKYSAVTGRSLLTSVQEIGGDGNNRLALPPTTFEYREALADTWQPSSIYAPPADSWLTHFALSDSNTWYQVNDGARLTDLNGDGVTDWVHSNLNINKPLLMVNTAWINLAGRKMSGTSAWKKWKAVPASLSLTLEKDRKPYTVDAGTRLVDLYGDGTLDIMNSLQSKDGQGKDGELSQKVWFNLPSGFDKTVQYETAAFWFTRIKTNTKTGKAYNLYDGFQLLDLNNDGLPDLIRSHYVQNKGFFNKTYLNTHSGWQVNTSYDLPDGQLLSYSYTKDEIEQNLDFGARMIDINGDGLLDLVRATSMIPNTTWLNSGNGWSASSIEGSQLPADMWLNRVLKDPNDDPYNIDTGVRVIDLNGDGLVDLFRAHLKGDWDNKTNEHTVKAYMNSGNNDNRWVENEFYAPEGLFLTVSIVKNKFERNIDFGTELVDVNGDGLPDIVYAVKSTNSDRFPSGNETYLNTGKGWVAAPNYNLPSDTWLTEMFNLAENTIPNAVRNGAQFSDLNGDGLLDIIHAVRDLHSSEHDHNKVWLNTGNGWKPVSNYDLPKGNNAFTDLFLNYTNYREESGDKKTYALNGNSRLVDINGDGMLDLLASHKMDNVPFLDVTGAWLNPGTAFPDRLEKITDGRLKTISVEYAPLTDSTVYIRNSVHQQGVRDIQNSAPVVKEYRITAAGKPFQHFRYQYYGLKFSERHGSMGFGSITKIDQLAKRKWETTFIQDNNNFERNGLVRQLRISSGAGLDLRTVNYTYYFDNIIPVKGMLPKLVQRVEDVSVLGNNGHKAYQTQKREYFDGYGNIYQVIEQSDLGNLFTHIQYDSDPDKWLLRFPVAEKVTRNYQYEDKFDSNKDLSWEKFSYTTNTMNVLTSKRWDSQNNDWGDETTYEYDPYGNVTGITDSEDRTTRITYDNAYHTFEASRSFPQVNGIVLTEKSKYDARFGVLSKETDPNNSYFSYTVDALGRITEKKGPPPGGVDALVLETYSIERYGGSGNTPPIVAFVTRSRGDWASEDDPVTRHRIWPYSRVIKDGVDRIYSEAYKSPNNKIVRKTRQYSNINGQLEVETLPYFTNDMSNLNTYAFTYDAAGNLKTMTGEGQVVHDTVTFGRNHVRYITNITGDTLLSKTTSTMNSKGQTIQRIDIDGAVTKYLYDELGRPTRITDPQGVVNTTTYSSRGQKIEINNPDAGSTKFQYSKTTGLLIGETDANDNNIVYEYDALNRLTLKIVTTKSGGKDSTCYYYDSGINGLGLLYRVEVKKDRIIQSSEQYDYDQTGMLSRKVVSIGNDQYVYRYAYDPQGRLIQQTFPDGSIQINEYYPDGSLKSIKSQEPGSTITSDRISFDQYTPLQQPSKMTFGNGLTAFYNHGDSPDDHRGLLKSHQLGIFDETSQTLTQKMIDKSYIWNPDYTLKEISDMRTDKSGGDQSQSFTYSPSKIGRLVQASGPYGTINYTHDTAGNLTMKDNQSFTYTGTGSHRAEPSAGAVSHLNYDLAGNLTDKESGEVHWQYIYNGENRLIEVWRDNQHVSTYQYDHAGRLLAESWSMGDQRGSKTYVGTDYVIISTTDTTVDRRYLSGPTGHLVSLTRGHNAAKKTYIKAYIPGLLGFFGRMQQQLDTWVQNMENPQLMTLFSQWVIMMIFSLGLSGMLWMILKSSPVISGQQRWTGVTVPPLLAALLILTVFGSALPLAAQNDSISEVAVQYFHHDYINSVDMITNQQGEIVSRAVFKPYGEVYQPSGDDSEYPEEFTGQEWDSPSGLYYFQARFYDPELGRFLTPDSELGNDPFAPAAFNRYAYAGGNPIIYNDPSGHFIFALILGAIIGAALGAAADAITQAAEGGVFDLDRFGKNIGLGALAGVVFGGFSSAFGAFGARIGTHLAAKASSEGWRKVINIVVGAVAESAAAVAAQSVVNLVEMAVTGAAFDGVALGIAAGIGAITGGLFGGALSQYVGKAARKVGRSSRGSKRVGIRNWSNSRAGTIHTNTTPRFSGTPRYQNEIGNPFAPKKWFPSFNKATLRNVGISTGHDMLGVIMYNIAYAFVDKGHDFEQGNVSGVIPLRTLPTTSNTLCGEH